MEKEYTEHKIFSQLSEYADFYDSLSFSIMSWINNGAPFGNLDTYVYSSMSGTLESIKLILLNGRINDSYALLRKYFDSTIINIYSNLYLEDNFGYENFIVQQIDDWRTGKQKLPEYRVMSKYIKDSQKLSAITILLERDRTYKNIRERCNDHTHYNYYENIILNDNEVYLRNRIRILDSFSDDIECIFSQHIAYLFYLMDHYMMSSDYTDSLEVGCPPEEGSEYFVAPFIQEVFDKILKPKRPDLLNEIKSKTLMKIE